MGRRGPPKTPDEEKVVYATFRDDRAQGETPKPPVKRPRQPAWLDPKAKTVWRRLMPEMLEHELMSGLDADVMAAYCSAVARMQSAEKALTRYGVVYKSRTGLLKKNPACEIASEAERTIALLGKELGLSPAARLRIERPSQKSRKPDSSLRGLKDQRRPGSSYA